MKGTHRRPGGAGLDVDRSLLRRGAESVVRRYARVREGERVALLSWRAHALRELITDAVVAAGAEPWPVDVEDLERTAEARVAHVLEERLRGCTVSLLLAEHGLPPPISMAILDSVEPLGLRHLHITRIEPRLFARSYCADPERIARINAHVASAIARAGHLEIRSPAGTALHVRLDPYFPLLESSGRPERGRAENLPAGFVLFHPADVEGVFVADRGAIGAVRPDPELVRRHPLRVTLARGLVESATSESETLEVAARRYLHMHEHAARVGIIALPTNYLVDSESGIELEDALLPGVNVSLGFASPEHTKALHRCPVQLRLFARELDVTAGDAVLVREGRLGDELARIA